MTVIAWDGKTLAADKRACLGTAIGVTTKIHRVDDYLVGIAGDASYGRTMLAWLQDGRKPDKFPASQADRDKFARVMAIWPGGEVWIYEDTPHPFRLEGRYAAIGSGRDFAMAAMHLGHDAERAVLVACALDSNCGNGVDRLHFV